MRNFFIGAALLLLSLHAAAAAKSTGSDDVLDAGLADDARAAGLPGVTAVPVVPPVTAVRVVAPATRSGAGAGAERQSAVGDSVDTIVDDARTADLFTVAPAAARRGRR